MAPLRGFGSRIVQFQFFMLGMLLRPPQILLNWMTRAPWKVDGERLDPLTQYVFMLGKFGQRSMRRMGPEASRQYYAFLNRALDKPPPQVASAVDLRLDTRCGPRAARAYYASNGSEQPALMYIHGGGHTIGSIDTHDALCRRLCVVASCVVISIDYRLAPEYPFPAAPRDCFDAFQSVVARSAELGIARDRIGIGGDSAGGNLATVVASMTRGSPVPSPCVQLLIYPVAGDIEHEGRHNPGLQRHYGLDAETIRWFTENYVQHEGYRDPGVAPLCLDSHEGLPPAIVATAHFDLLRGEGLDYVRALETANVPVTHLHYLDLPHGFGTMSALPRACEAIDEIAAVLRSSLQEGSPP